MAQLDPILKPIKTEQHSLAALETSAKDGDAGNRQIEVGPKPDGRLSAAKHPILYIGRTISNFLGRISEAMDEKDRSTIHYAKRTLVDPFATKKQKDEAYKSLCETLVNPSETNISFQDCEYITNNTIEIINFFEKNDREKASTLAIILSKSEVHKLDTCQYIPLIKILKKGNPENLEKFITGINFKYVDAVKYSGATFLAREREAFLDEIIGELKKQKNSLFTPDQKILMAKRIIVHGQLQNDLKLEKKAEALKILFQAARENKENLSSVVKDLIKTALSLESINQTRTLVDQALNSDEPFQLTEEEKEDLAKAAEGLNCTF